MIAYKQLVKKVLGSGELRPNRTGIDTVSLFGETLVHNMQEGLPLLTTKAVNYKACIHELIWFLKGGTNIKYLNDNGVHIWDPWADENGDLGPVYGKQWTDSGFKHVNQVHEVIKLIQEDPYSRRILIDSWSPSELSEMALPPCHVLYQFYAEPKTKNLSLNVYMRSADLFLGVPFDIAEGGMLLTLISKLTGYTPYMLKYFFGDVHIYTNHLGAIKQQISRNCFKLPTLLLPTLSSIEDYKFEDFNIVNYKCHARLKGAVAV